MFHCALKLIFVLLRFPATSVGLIEYMLTLPKNIAKSLKHSWIISITAVQLEWE